MSDSLGFDRVWMIKDGELVEDDQPQRLAADAQSAYAQLLKREKSVQALIWNSADWVRLRLEKGKLVSGEKQTDAQKNPCDSTP